MEGNNLYYRLSSDVIGVHSIKNGQEVQLCTYIHYECMFYPLGAVQQAVIT